MSAAVAGTTFRPTPSYTTLRDVTAGNALDVLMEGAAYFPARRAANVDLAQALHYD